MSPKTVSFGVIIIIVALLVGAMAWLGLTITIQEGNDGDSGVDVTRVLTKTPKANISVTKKPLPTSKIKFTPKPTQPLATPTPDSSKTQPTPTIKVSPTLPPIPTSTPASQNTQVIVSFLPGEILLCQQSSINTVNNLIAQGENEINANDAEYESCKDPLEQQLNACVDDCSNSSNLMCLLNCDQTYTPQLQECEDTHNSKEQEIQNRYREEFKKYCSII